MLPNDDKIEFVFICGSLRRNASHAFRMADARFVGMAEVSGKLLDLGGRAVALPGGPEGWITGDLLAVTPEQLREIDDFEGEGYERVEMNVYQEGSRHQLGGAWVWRWKGGLENARLVRSGDWFDVELPRTAPWLTWVSLLSLAFPPVAAVALDSWHYSLDPALRELWKDLMLALLGAPLAALFAAWFGEKRRERLPKLRTLLLIVSAGASLLAILIWVLLLVGLFT